MLNFNQVIYIAGHNGLVGSSIVRHLKKQGYKNLVMRTRKELDLTNQAAVQLFFQGQKIDCIIIAAAKVGGIYANNTYAADFIYQNLMIEANIIHSAYQNKIKKILFLGSSCIYPKFSKQPIVEEELLTGSLEKTNEAYAISKIAGIKLCESYNQQYGTDYRSVMPTNLYGICDNFHEKNSHVIPALINRFHEAKINNKSHVSIWGSGKVKREFLYVDDLASACIHILGISKDIFNSSTENYVSHVNIGTGKDITIRELAESISEIVGYKGKLIFDASKPSGTPQKLLNIDKLTAFDWEYKTELQDGLRLTYNWYTSNIVNIRRA
jgi:GDP-L-fucose synthase